MTVAALLLRGVPPSGLGIFTRDQLVPGPWSFYCVDDRIGGGSFARAARERGPIWLFRGPGSWTPDAWRATLAAQLVAAAELGATGIVANPERDWQTASGAEREAFGLALREASKHTRIGVVTIPSWGPFETVARAAGTSVWWSPEFYSQSVSESAVPGWWDRWVRVVGGRAIPTFAAFQPPNDSDRTLSTPEGYERHLDSMPHTSGAMVWVTHPIRPYMLDAMQRRWGFGGSRALLVPLLSLGALSSTPNGAALVVLSAVLLVLALGFVLRAVGRG